MNTERNSGAPQPIQLPLALPQPNAEPAPPPGAPARPQSSPHRPAGRGHLTFWGSPYSARTLQAAYLDWCEDAWFDGIALTVTFKPSWQRQLLTDAVAESTIRHFLSRLNRQFSKRPRNVAHRLKVIAVREGGIGMGNKRLHYHLKIEVPTDLDRQEFCAACLYIWSKLDWASATQNRATACSDKHWIAYILKLRDKADFATAIDINNTNLRSP